MLIDTHAHLDVDRFHRDRDEVVKRAQEKGVEKIINVGFDGPSSEMAVKLAEKYDMVYTAVGIHPHDAKKADDDTYELLYNLTKRDKVVALGEMGLDYYRNLSPRELQQEVFKTQISLAKEVDLPIVIHDRDAHGDTLKIIKQERASLVGGVLHCFSGSSEMALECIKMGFYISFAGPVTYPNARRLIKVVEDVPLERMLVETDCPWLSPEPQRGKRNEPAYVQYVAEKIAEIKNMPLEEVIRITTKNAKDVFRLP